MWNLIKIKLVMYIRGSDTRDKGWFSCPIGTEGRFSCPLKKWTPKRRFLGKRSPVGKVVFWLNTDGGIGSWQVW